MLHLYNGVIILFLMFEQQTVNNGMTYLDTISSETFTQSKVLSKKIKSYVESDGSISFFVESA